MFINAFFIKLIDENAFVINYKVRNIREYVLTINEDFEYAGLFHEDDYLLQLLKINKVSFELLDAGKISLPEENIPQPEIDLEMYNWI